MSVSLSFNIKSFRFKKKSLPFFEGMSYNFLEKKKYVLLGRSGVGKSTLMKIILDLHDGLLNGDVKFNENEIIYSSKDLKRAKKIGYLSFEDSLVPWKNVEQNMLLPSLLNPESENPESNEIKRMLCSVDLDENVIKKMPYELSFGMKMRVQLARVFLYKPTFIFLDELFTGVDSITSLNLTDFITRFINNSTNAICLSITHDIDKAILLADEILIMRKNSVIYPANDFSKEYILNELKKDI